MEVFLSIWNNSFQVYGAKIHARFPKSCFALVRSHYNTLGIIYPMNVCNIRPIYTDIDCPGQNCRRVPPSTIASCSVVVVRGNSKLEDLIGGLQCVRSFLGSGKKWLP
jgi:hypothetical protein